MALISEFSDSVVCLSFHFIKKVGPIKGRRIINMLSQRTGLIDDYVDAVMEVSSTSADITRKNVIRALELADIEIEKARGLDVQVLPIISNEYPKKLSQISDAPLALFLLGNVEALNRSQQVAVVGTRKPSVKGGLSCQRITQTLVENGVNIVSGLALGCDTIAHETCLNAKGITIAVMPCGLDTVAPLSNRDLLNAIVNSGGTIVSEYPLGIKPSRGNYVQRNRIQSGLSSAVIIIEAGSKSGTMKTAEYCKIQGRDLYAVNPDTFDVDSDAGGNRDLIDSGVRALNGKDDIQYLIQKLDDFSENDLFA